MTTIYNYRVYCETDGQYETVWRETEPTTCPVDTAHSIDSTRTTIIDSREENVVTIREETTPTGGNFGCESITINAIKNSTTSVNTFWPHPVSILALEFVTTTTHQEDCISTSVSKDTITGAITATVSPAAAWVSQNYTAGTSVLYNSKLYTCTTNTVSSEVPTNNNYWTRGFRLSVVQTVIDYVAIGYYMYVDDFTNKDEMGRVISIDTENNYLYMESNAVNSFSPATPSYIRQTVYTIKDYEIGPAWNHIIGESKIGGSYIPADTVLTIDYLNKSITSDKKFIGRVEYMY